MTREELMSKGCGIYCDTRDCVAWQRKQRELYKMNNVLEYFKTRRAYFLKGGSNPYQAGKAAQAETDEMLFKLAAGVGNATPATQNALVPDTSGLVDIAEFGDAADAEIDPIRDLTWIYNNMAVKNVKPSDAPSPGAYAHLQFVQENDQNKVDFFTRVYPRIIPAKSQVENVSRYNDDNRTTLDILDRLQGESKDGSGEIPVL